MADLEPVAERVVDVEAPRPRDRLVERHLVPALAQALGEVGQVVGDQAGMRLAGGCERFLDPDVQLLRPGPEPAAAARCKRARLRELLEPEERAVERARLVLASGWGGNLNVVDS